MLKTASRLLFVCGICVRCAKNERKKRSRPLPIAVGAGGATYLCVIKCGINADFEGAAAYFSSQMGSFSIQRPYSSL